MIIENTLRTIWWSAQYLECELLMRREKGAGVFSRRLRGREDSPPPVAQCFLLTWKEMMDSTRTSIWIVIRLLFLSAGCGEPMFEHAGTRIAC